MSQNINYEATAQAYADEVRILLAPPEAPAGMRGGRGPVSHEELAARAEHLLPVSASLTTAAADKLAAPSPETRAEASMQLLAKAMTELRISAYLKQAADEEQDGTDLRGSGATERGAGESRADEELLNILTGTSLDARDLTQRRGAASRNLDAARRDLLQASDETLSLISGRAAETGKVAVSGLLGLSLAELGQAAAHLGLGVAEALGQGEALSHLYRLVRDYALQAYEAFVALLGRGLAAVVGEKVVEWVEEVKEAEFFEALVKRMYQTEQTQAAIAQLVDSSTADLASFEEAAERVEALRDEYGAQVSLAEKALKWAKYLGGIPSAVLPHGTLLMAAVYLVLCGYVVLVGADYVDAPQLNILRRVSGVRTVIEGKLVAA